MIGGAIILIVVGIALGIFFPLLFIVSAVGIALLLVALFGGVRERRAAASANPPE